MVKTACLCSQASSGVGSITPGSVIKSRTTRVSPHPALEISVLTLRWSQAGELVETATDGALAQPGFQIKTQGPVSPNILRKEPDMQRKPADRNVHHRIIYMHT